MVDVATEYGIFLSMDQELKTILYFISSARQKKQNRQETQQVQAAAASGMPR